MQSALDRLYEWVGRSGMEFNIPKCTVMHLGNQNLQHEYVTGGGGGLEVLG
jgi:hypothetical protein